MDRPADHPFPSRHGMPHAFRQTAAQALNGMEWSEVQEEHRHRFARAAVVGFWAAAQTSSLLLQASIDGVAVGRTVTEQERMTMIVQAQMAAFHRYLDECERDG